MRILYDARTPSDKDKDKDRNPEVNRCATAFK